MRKNTKVVLWVVVVGFVGFMFYNWGMNQVNTGGAEPGVVGKVGDERISWDEFRTEFRNQYQAYFEQEGRRPDAAAERQMNEQTWEALIQRRLLYMAANQEGLDASNDEILMEMQSNPPPFIRNHPAFQTDSLFDQSKYINALADPSLDFAFLETYVRESLPLQKLQDYIGSSVRITDEEAKMLMTVLEEQVTISYLNIDPNTHVRESVSSPGVAELNEFYESHQEDFRVQEKRRIGVLEFPKEPSAEDKIDAREKIDDAFEIVSDGEPFAEIAPDYSDDPASAPRGGDLGWVKPGQLPGKLDSVAWGLGAGEISNVVETAEGFHLVKAESIRVVEGVEERKLSYISSVLEASPLTIERIRANAADLMGEAAGGSLGEAAEEAGYEYRVTDPYVKEQIAPFLGVTATDAENIFSAGIGELVGPVEGRQSFFVFEVAGVEPTRIQPLDEIQDFVAQAYVFDIRKQRARVIADEIAGKLRGGEPFESAGEAWNIDPVTTQPFSRMSFVPGIGRENAVIANSFALTEGEISGVIEDSDQFYIVRVDSMQPMDMERFRNSLGNIKLSLLGTKQQVYMTDWYTQVKDAAEIVDFRSQYGSY
ncbi:peptidyl-prolyl cis-trans isomerase [Candidatus Eisenbacteria bacterium]|uniref:Periplasmic chaperone PpiD n=1 Tax=Eiseniibacteriota bacterium TaxID=2212470 RepID=A0ABV6YNH4_UNCEI